MRQWVDADGAPTVTPPPWARRGPWLPGPGCLCRPQHCAGWLRARRLARPRQRGGIKAACRAGGNMVVGLAVGLRLNQVYPGPGGSTTKGRTRSPPRPSPEGSGAPYAVIMSVRGRLPSHRHPSRPREHAVGGKPLDLPPPPPPHPPTPPPPPLHAHRGDYLWAVD